MYNTLRNIFIIFYSSYIQSVITGANFALWGGTYRQKREKLPGRSCRILADKPTQSCSIVERRPPPK